MITGDAIQVARGPAGKPDAVIATRPEVLRDLIFAGSSLDTYLELGEIMVVGDPSRPAPVHLVPATTGIGDPVGHPHSWRRSAVRRSQTGLSAKCTSQVRCISASSCSGISPRRIFGSTQK